MRIYKKSEIAHLKWKLIHQDGLSPSQAQKRIEKMRKWLEKHKNEKN